ncbi:hypothetical protein GALMADRAFT_135481 [Galerina marginata CBS 339.88]|uniref:F-box domain-containing protein n=1 Tax=Galerina marginata (strain CBS 339.88) TaxID=685588 RepID=A0A067TIE0_GALM3|nr:hypothetical protein GALMADRAFT_135481 [Galerina marginata CBS 339.88]
MLQCQSGLASTIELLVSEIRSSSIQEPFFAADRIPTEIWQEIFLILLSSERIPGLEEIFGPIWGRACPPLSSRGTLILPRTPALLSQVCRRWKYYAFGMPDLWNVLFVKTARSEAGLSAQNLKQLLNDRLCLSKAMPLKICLTAKDDEGGARKLIRAIIPFCSQWETIHLQVPPAALSELDDLQPEDLPRITSLKTHSQTYTPPGSDRNRDSSAEPAQIRLLKKIPYIRRLCTSYFLPPICPVYAGLEELHIQQDRCETWSTLSVLAACSRLRVLTLSGFGVTKATGAPSSPHLRFLLPALETLNLEHPLGREPLLQKLILPNFKSLWIGGRCCGESIRSILNSVVQIMKRSEVCSLERLSLSLETHNMDGFLLINFLACNPMLRELHVDDTWKFLNRPLVTSGLLQALAYMNNDHAFTKTDASYLCPRLERITLTECSDFEDENLVAFLKTRCSPAAGITRTGFKGNWSPTMTVHDVDISIKRGVGRELVEIASCWAAQGFSINLRRVALLTRRAHSEATAVIKRGMACISIDDDHTPSSMTKFKFNFHLKFSSASSPDSSRKNFDTSQETQIRRSVKDYITNFKVARLFTPRTRSQKAVEVRASSPVLFRGKTPRMPLASLYAPRPTGSESIPTRRHRRHTVRLIQLPEHTDCKPSTPDLLSTQEIERFESSNPVAPSGTQPRSMVPDLSTGSMRPQEVENKRLQEPAATNEKSDARRIAEVLQQATRQICTDGRFSQTEAFQFLAPLVAFACFMGMGVTLPRYSGVENLFGMGPVAGLILALLGGVGFALIALRASIWVVGVFTQSFCQLDLEGLLRKTELVDANGKRIGEAEMVVGLFV